MLTDEQRKKVEKNHSLIYWIMNTKHLNEDWYDLLAIELCKTVMSFDESKGSLSNYYKIRCESMIGNEMQKINANKRAKPEEAYRKFMESSIRQKESQYDDGYISLCDFVTKDKTGILALKAEGFSQSEIADILGLSQSFVSRTITAYKELYYDKKKADES